MSKMPIFKVTTDHPNVQKHIRERFKDNDSVKIDESGEKMEVRAFASITQEDKELLFKTIRI